MRIVFAGTPEFSATILGALLDRDAELVGVYTQPDRPAGRGRRPRASPVKQLAESRGLRIRQPANLRDADAAQTLTALRPELMVVAAYGLILPPSLLAVPRSGCINVHASLLPRWRGAAPIQRALLAGDTLTGISIMRMDAGLDTGPVLRQARCAIHPADSAGTLHDRLATIGATELCATLDDLAHDNIRETAQQEAQASYAPRIEKTEALIVWDRSAVEIERRVRAFDPYPVTYTLLPKEHRDETINPSTTRLRVWQAQVVAAPADTGELPGTVLATATDGIDVATDDGILRLTRVQRAGGRVLAVRDFLNAYPLPVGARLGVGPDATAVR